MESLHLLETPRVFGFLPHEFPCRISIPTLHVIGKDDQFAEHSQTLVELCQPDKAEVMVVEGGHDLPRSKQGLDECARLFDMVTLMGRLMRS
jgi:pimeloyl-ACP methyl ester carboxylesterase